MNNKILNIFKISLFAFFISSYSFGNEITLNVNQAKNDYRSCYFIVDAFNNTNMNITEIWFNVVYYFKDGYVIDQGNWKWERLRPNKSKLIVDSQSYVRTDEKNMPCNEVGRVEINDLWYMEIDGKYVYEKDFYQIYDIIKIINNLPNIQVVKN